MKKLILGVASLLCVSVQTMAQQPPPPIHGSGNITTSGARRTPTSPTTSITATAPSTNVTATSGYSSSNGLNGVGNITAISPAAVATTNLGAVNVSGSTRAYTWNDAQDQADDPMKTKTFSKSFSLDRNDKVNVSNVYGSITIKTWEKNEIKVDADIKAFATTENDAQKLLDGVTIRATKEGDQVTYKTSMEERNGNSGRGNSNGKKWRREVKVYYTVYLPKNNALNVSQEYGNVLMDDYNGPTSLRVEYGSITAGDLNNANNYVSVEYGGAKFNDINQAKIRLEYGSSGLTIGTIGTIDLDAQYSKVNITTIKNSGNIRTEYGSGINITNANNLTLNSHYIATKINTLTGNTTAKLEYGSFSVANVETSVKSFNIISEYTPINLGFDANFNANFTVSTDFAPFRYGTTITAKKLGDEKGYSNSRSYSGQIGKGGTANISVKAEYGSVTFK